MYLLLFIILILLMIMAQTLVSNAYARYRHIQSLKGYTGEMIANLILERNALKGVDVYVSEGGRMSDHYDSKLKRICLSNDVYYGNSIASIAIAAHECGHALQDNENYGLIAWRNTILPFVNISAQAGWIILLLGFLSSTGKMMDLAMILLVFSTLFQVITLPLEINASKRAMAQLKAHCMILEEERTEIDNMLKAASFTYVAALISSISYIIRFISMKIHQRQS